MDDRELLQAFEAASLTAEQWTHPAHVRVAYLSLRQHPFPEALRRMRSGIRALNAQLGVEESATSGYNETTTHAFLQLIAATTQAYGGVMPTDDSESFCRMHPHLLQKHVLRLFYSPERRLHPDAKHAFVEPDLAALPRLRGVRN